jgi:very-short-patch-repair endonuclease
VVEVAGRRGHSSDTDRAKDARRRNELQSLGITVLEFTSRNVVADPATAVHDVAAHLQRLGLAIDRVAPMR